MTKLIKNFKSLHGFWGRCLKIRDVCMDFETNFKVHNLISIYPKSIKLGQMTNLNMINTNLNMIFMLWCQFIDWFKFETRPSSLLNFGTAYQQINTTGLFSHTHLIQVPGCFKPSASSEFSTDSTYLWTSIAVIGVELL